MDSCAGSDLVAPRSNSGAVTPGAGDDDGTNDAEATATANREYAPSMSAPLRASWSSPESAVSRSSSPEGVCVSGERGAGAAVGVGAGVCVGVKMGAALR